MSMVLTLIGLDGRQLDEVLTNPQVALDLVFSEPSSDSKTRDVYLDKAWHGIHYLLTGTAFEGDPPLNVLVPGGEQLPDPDEEWGYGPPWVLRPEEVASTAQALAALSDAELRARFDPVDMDAKDIYPRIIWVRDGDGALDYLMEYVASLRKFFSEAAADRQAALIALS